MTGASFPLDAILSPTQRALLIEKGVRYLSRQHNISEEDHLMRQLLGRIAQETPRDLLVTFIGENLARAFWNEVDDGRHGMFVMPKLVNHAWMQYLLDRAENALRAPEDWMLTPEEMAQNKRSTRKGT